jgi:septum site-determining protein MinD
MIAGTDTDRADSGNDSDPLSIRGRVIAIVSGKGGSGKTMLAAEIAQILSAGDSGIPATLMDIDLGTGGLSYYFGIKQVRNIKEGLIDLLFEKDPPSRPVVLSKLQSVARESAEVKFLPIGEFGRLGPRVGDRYPSINELSAPLVTVLKAAITHLRRPDGVVIVDCRGGIDEEMLTICGLVDHIILVSEADTTSFQASRHLAETLSQASLAHKVIGFILNKVFEDPAVVTRNGAALFGAQALGSIPFDFEATRAFLIGDIPNSRSVFGVHVRDALSRAYPVDVEPPEQGVWTQNDYNSLSLASPESLRGGTFLGILITLLGGSLCSCAQYQRSDPGSRTS